MKKTRYIFEREKVDVIILLHLLTFEIVTIQYEYKDLWIDEKWEQFPENLLERLLEKKFLVNYDDDDSRLLKMAYQKFGKTKLKVPNIVIYLTNECNLRCSYCYSGYENDKKNEMITINDIDKIFDSIDVIYQKRRYLSENPIISLFGGEPLLLSNKDNIAYIINKLNEKKYEYFEIVTNLINVRLFADIINDFCGEMSFRVTINGDEQLHNKIRKFPNGKETYKTILQNISFVLNNIRNATIDLSILIDNEINVQRVERLFFDLERYGFLNNPKIRIKFGHIQFRSNYVCPGFENRVLDVSKYYPILFDFAKKVPSITNNMIEGSSMHILKEIYQSLIENEKVVVPNFTGCDAVYPGRYCFFTDGKIYPCFDCVGMVGFEIGQYRNCLEFNEEYFRWNDFKVTELEKCNNCKFVGICNGGCLVSNKSKEGNLYNVHCEKVTESFDNILDYWYKEGIFNEILY